MQDEAAADQRTTGHCPHCGTPVDPAASVDGVIRCPGCGASVSPRIEPNRSESGTGALEYAAPATPSDRHGDFAQELDGLRIKQVTTLRRGAARARSYLVIGVFASAVTAVKLVTMAVDHVQATGWGRLPVGYLMFALAALGLAGYFGRRAMELHRELKIPASLPPAPAEPDFSTLSDGSQHWKNLEDIR